MLRAYFDDSGTHDGSETVVVAGIVGTESEIRSLEGLWKDVLEDPLSGTRSPLKEFHAFDCYHSEGDFAGWKRAETDYLRRQLRDVIITSRVSAYGVAYSKNDWDELITGHIRDILGNAEGNAVRNCFVRVLHWTQWNAFDPDLEFVFDASDNLDRKRDICAVYDAFKQNTTINNICGVSFLDSEKCIPLQAADLFAWEFNRYAKMILEVGLQAPAPLEMSHLEKNMSWLDGQIALRERILRVRAHVKSQHTEDVLAEFANHFRSFGGDEFLPKRERRKRRR